MRRYILLLLLIISMAAQAQTLADPDIATAEAESLAQIRQEARSAPCPSREMRLFAPTEILPYRPDAQFRRAVQVNIAAFGCGDRSFFHYLVLFRTGGGQVVQPFVHGSTIVDIVLKRDIGKAIIAQLALLFPDCQQFRIKSARFDGPVDAPFNRLPWNETWFVVACNRLYELPVTFTPNERGTAYATHSTQLKPASYGPDDFRAN